ncbi:hypothetical protein VE04_04343 [Pseudogymnoascus sp. 24MN13]|nr:hypothetical protein VE04_04343 [Pseudogymnoascus sp. 24MN13]
MADNLKEQKIPSEGDSSRQQSYQHPDPNSIHMQQAQEGQLPPAYAPSPSPQFQQSQFQQPQQAYFQQGQFAQQPQFAQPQQQYFIQLPNGTMQAVAAPPQQPIMMTPVKEQPTIIVNNAPSASAAAAVGGGVGGGGGGGGGGGSNTDACLAEFARESASPEYTTGVGSVAIPGHISWQFQPASPMCNRLNMQ